jgi:hypothetical protein
MSRYAKAFGMKIFYNDINKSKNKKFIYLSKKKLFQFSDILVVSISLNTSTHQIINREFHLVNDFANDFLDLVQKVSNNETKRIAALQSTLGYLIHGYKDRTNQKAIIFNDQEIDDNANGGSGKSLMLTALGYLRISERRSLRGHSVACQFQWQVRECRPSFSRLFLLNWGLHLALGFVLQTINQLKNFLIWACTEVAHHSVNELS